MKTSMENNNSVLCICDTSLDPRYRKPLEAAGCSIADVIDKRAAIEAVRTASPKLIVLHTSSPDDSGLQLLRCLNSVPETAEVPVFVVSNFSEQKCAKLLDSGAIGFCHRDHFTREVLQSALKKVERRYVPLSPLAQSAM